MKAHIISFVNFKGGCTKTSTMVNLGAALARRGKRVLLVDCDPQSHVAVHLGIDREDIGVTVEDVLGVKGRTIDDAVMATSDSNLWVAPSGRALSNARHNLAMKPRKEALLARAIKPVEGEVDYILIDTPPDDGLLSFNAIYACRSIIIPTLLDTFSLTGIRALLDAVDSMKEAYEERWIDVFGVLINRYDERLKRNNRMNLTELSDYFGNTVFDTRIRVDEEVRLAQSAGQTIFARDEKSKGAVDFERLAGEVESRKV